MKKSLAAAAFAIFSCGGEMGGVGSNAGGLTPGGNNAGRQAVTSCPTSPAGGLMTNAVCLCDSFLGAGTGLTTKALAGNSANVAINGQLMTAGRFEIGGNMTAYEGFGGAGQLIVRDNATTFGNAAGAGQFDIGKDLAVKGDFTFAGNAKVGGTLKVGGQALSAPKFNMTAAAFDLKDEKPCGCDAASILDIGAKVAAAKADKNMKVLEQVRSVGNNTIAVKSGSYMMDGRFTTVGKNTISIEGGVAMYVDGDMTLVGDSQFDLKAGATLDLYISGSMLMAGHTMFKSEPAPGAVRLYLGGNMMGAGQQDLNLSIYAPKSDLMFAGGTKIGGSVFGKTLMSAGKIEVGYAAPTQTDPSMCTPETPAPGGTDGTGNTPPAGGGTGPGVN